MKKRSRYIQGVRVDFGLSRNDFLELLKTSIEGLPGSKYVCTVNPEFMIKAWEDREFKQTINESYLSIPDGVGVLMADKYLNKVENITRNNVLFPIMYFIKGVQVGFKSLFKPDYLEERLAGSKLVYNICEMAQRNNWNVFLLGGWDKNILGKMKTDHGDIATKTANKLKKMYPDLRIIGATSDFSDKKEDDEKTVNYMKRKMSDRDVDKIDLVLVAYSFGNQEKWLRRNLQKLPAKVGIGLGGTFDQIIGNQRRCPKLFVNLHLEWLFRLITQPWRLKRILTAFPYFPLRVYISSLKQK